MNRYLKIILIMMITFIIPLSVFADTITDTKITNITIPENWKLITKDNMNEMMDWLGLDSVKKISYKYSWNNNFYYADIVKETKDVDINIIVKEADIDYEDISIYMYDVKEIEDQVKGLYNGIEIDISSYNTQSGIKYYLVNYINENNENIIDCLTTIHGNMYLYRLKSSSELTEEVKSDFMNIVNSVEYENYLEFIEKNKIELEQKKSSSPVGFIIILLIIIIGGITAYIFINKKKKNINKVSNTTQVYNPVQVDTKNPAVADFIETNNINNSNNNINPSVADFLNQDNDTK